jgi:hypothetical protein
MTLVTPTPQVERDRYGRPRIKLPDSGRLAYYTRATTIAGTLDDRYSLEKWLQRQVAIGMGKRPDLVALAATAAVDDRTTLDNVVAAATDAAAADAKANLGTALHALTEAHDRGLLTDVPAMFAAELAAYIDATEHLRWLEIEQMVVLDPHSVAGTPDRIGLAGRRRRAQIYDIKTGSIDFSMGSIAVQMAIYAHANNIYVGGDRLPMPEIDLTRAVIIHLPVGKGTCELVEVDIEAGWEAFQLAMAVREWRKRKDLSRVIDSTVVRSEPNEGRDEPAEAVAHLRAAYEGLEPAARAWVTTIGNQAHTAGVSFRLSGAEGRATERRVTLMATLIELARYGYDQDDAIRGLLEQLHGDVAQFGNVTTGHLVGLTDVDQALRLSALADALTSA